MRLDDGRFGDAVDFEHARFIIEPDQELSLRRIQTPELRFLGERPQRGRVVLSGARVGQPGRQGGELAGARRAVDGAASPTRR